MPERLRARLGRERLVGTFLTLPGAATAELFAEAFDVVVVDLEHAALSRRDAQDLLVGAQAAGALALVRVPAADPGLLAVALDAGADGVVVPDVRDAATALAVAAALRRPPDGVRGFGPRRLATRGRLRAAARLAEVALVVQVEHPDGVAAAPALAALDAVDALLVGSADLSVAVGTPLDLASAPLAAAIRAVRAACAAGGMPLGVAGPLDAAPDAALDGAALLLHATDARLASAAADDAAARLRARAARGGRAS